MKVNDNSVKRKEISVNTEERKGTNGNQRLHGQANEAINVSKD